MRRWDLTIALDPERELSLFLQLAHAIAEDIQRGRLKPGDPLPGSRELAAYLGVNRNTVIASYDELAAEGLVVTRMGSGTFVARPAAAPATPPALAGDIPTYPLHPAVFPVAAQEPPAPGMLLMARGSPDVRLLPARALARAFRRAIGLHGRTLLTYTDPRGHERLRNGLAAMLTHTRDLLTTPRDVMITRGSEQGIDLVARTLLAPGDVVVVEALGYPPAWSILKLAGARMLPVPVDADGLDIDALEALLEQQRVRAVFVTPHHQFPTATVMSTTRRRRLAELSLQHRFIIIEDDYDHEFHYEGRPVLPIAAGTARANVVYIGSLSNLLAPGFSTGFIVAPAPVLERLVATRAACDAQGDAAVECAIAELFEDGEFLRHVRRMRQAYATRRDALVAALVRHLGSAVDFEVPGGGMALWARVDEGIDVAAWASAGEREGVLFRDSRGYDFMQGDPPFVRLGFTYHDEAELDQAVRGMARALLRTRAVRPTGKTMESARPADRGGRRDDGDPGQRPARNGRSSGSDN